MEPGRFISKLMSGAAGALLSTLLLTLLAGCSDKNGADGNPPTGTAGTGTAAGGSLAPAPVGTAGTQNTGTMTTGTGGTTGMTTDTGGQGAAGTGSTTDTPVPTTGASGVWPMMGFDERNWYFNPNETTLSVANAATLVEKWRFTTGGNPNGTPIIAEGKVFVMASGGGTYALSLETGEQIWNIPALAGTASVAYEPGFIYVHDAQSQLWKLNSADGSTVWGPQKADAQPGCDGTSSPILGGGAVVVGHSCGLREVGQGGGPNGARGGVEAHSTSDGAKLWTYWTAAETENGAMVWSSVGIDVGAGTVFASTGNNYTAQGPNSDAIHAIDLAAGTRKWMTQVRDNDVWSIPAAFGGPDTDFGANPIVAGTSVAAGDKGSGFWAMNTSTGDILWSREGLTGARDQAHGGFLMNGAYDGKNFYGVANDTSTRGSVLYAFDGATGNDAFPPKTFPGKYAWGAPSLANGVLAVPINETLYLLDASSGAELNSFNTGGTIAAGAPAIVDGYVCVGSGLAYPLATDTLDNNQVICYGLP
ncbi:MAG: PQQ-binding-like beta-propeller repeat protein [Myxococcales bacterium]|nr:PQQ-binding-like beta-propeller repeat protein [Myxococcales bacterium]